MRSFILGIVILVAAPAYVVSQRPDPSERRKTGRTAEPREKTPLSAPASQATGRPERRAEARTPRTERSDDVAPARSRWMNSPGLLRSPSSIAWPNYRPPARRPHGRPNIVFVPYVAPIVIDREVVVERKIVAEADARLILDVYPPTAQIFADGYYIGMPEGFRFEDGGAVLEPGRHRIDILERDYEPVSFEVNLTRGQSATYRHMLTPIRRAPQPAPRAAVKSPPVPKQPSTFYLIPGCYMGNVPPKEANLPATCDLARTLSFPH
jgi:hypothetical protein